MSSSSTELPTVRFCDARINQSLPRLYNTLGCLVPDGILIFGHGFCYWRGSQLSSKQRIRNTTPSIPHLCCGKQVIWTSNSLHENWLDRFFPSKLKDFPSKRKDARRTLSEDYTLTTSRPKFAGSCIAWYFFAQAPAFISTSVFINLSGSFTTSFVRHLSNTAGRKEENKKAPGTRGADLQPTNIFLWAVYFWYTFMSVLELMLAVPHLVWLLDFWMHRVVSQEIGFDWFCGMKSMLRGGSIDVGHFCLFHKTVRRRFMFLTSNYQVWLLPLALSSRNSCTACGDFGNNVGHARITSRVAIVGPPGGV